MKDINSNTQNNVVSLSASTHSVVFSMINEYGYAKTATAIQALYDADALNEKQAQAMLDALNEYKVIDYGMHEDLDVKQARFIFTPVTLH